MSKKTNNKNQKKTVKNQQPEELQEVHVDSKRGATLVHNIMLPPKVVKQIAEEVGKAVSTNLVRTRRVKSTSSKKKIENPLVLDTSAIIDGRIFDLVRMGAFYGNFVVLTGVLDELKNIADSKDDVKKERGRKAMVNLDEFKKMKGVKMEICEDDKKIKEVDERIIQYAKKNKGRIITCDFNLSQKAKIGNVVSIDLYEMANILKTTAVPGEEFFVKVIQKGKAEDQGVGYLPDGTMIVIENGSGLIGNSVKVEVSRIIQTDSGRILFSKVKSAAN